MITLLVTGVVELAVMGREHLSTKSYFTSLHCSLEIQTGISCLFRDFAFSEICFITQSKYR